MIGIDVTKGKENNNSAAVLNRSQTEEKFFILGP